MYPRGPNVPPQQQYQQQQHRPQQQPNQPPGQQWPATRSMIPGGPGGPPGPGVPGSHGGHGGYGFSGGNPPPQGRMNPAMRGPPQVSPKMGGPVPQGGAHLQRRLVADKIISDCYSKQVVEKNGRKIPETTYQTHLAIKEFSSYPSQSPPENLPPNQVGSVKDRILVICTKYSGRVLIQKGKLNELKNVYQIGRTWDMDELTAIKRVGNTGLILSLNKDYYWRVDDGLERIWKFSRHLTNVYGEFMGKYPVLHGFTLQDFKLPLTPVQKSLAARSDSTNTIPNDVVVNNAVPDPQLMKINSSKKKDSPSSHVVPILVPAPPPQKASEHYRNFDFTSNGKLPIKQMKVMDVDRHGSTTSLNSQGSSSKSKFEKATPPVADAERFLSHKTKSVHTEASNDSQNSVFKAKEAYSPEKLHDYVRETRETSPLRNFKPRLSSNNEPASRNVSETFKNSAALGIQLENQLNNGNSDDENEFIKEFTDALPKGPEHPFQSPDFGIEEITDESDSEQAAPINAHKKSDADKFQKSGLDEDDNRNINTGLGISKKPDLSDKSVNTKTIDSSMQEIEDMLDSHISFGGHADTSEIDSFQFKMTDGDEDFNAPPSTSRHIDTDLTDTLVEEILEPKSDKSYSFDESNINNTSVMGLNINKTIFTTAEKDPEVEELLEEVNWKLLDTSSTLIKKLTAELNKVKQKNVLELISLDFSNNEVSNDVTTSREEIENLNHIFKKMEIDFKFLAPEINQIEDDSQGLQVKSINKKLLCEDLRGILDKVSINNNDLREIETFNDFGRLNKLENLELKLLELYNALETIRVDDNEEKVDFSSMRALQQYKTNYENISSIFISNFITFIKSQLQFMLNQVLENLSIFRSQSLFRELNNLLIYSGITYFIKDVGRSEFQDLNQHFNQLMSDFLEELLKVKIKALKFSSNNNTKTKVAVIEAHTLTKSRTLKLTRKMSKFGTLHEDSRPQIPETLTNYTRNEIEDPKIVINIIDETKSLINIIQLFICNFFHYDTNIFDFNEYIHEMPYTTRREMLDELPPLDSDRIYSTNLLIVNMTSIFGNYINGIMKKVKPALLNLPVVLIYLETVMNDIQSQNIPNHEYLVYNYLKKSIDRFKSNWTKFISSQIELLNKSSIFAKSGILQSIKNINQLLLITESSLEPHNLRQTQVRQMVDQSYKEINEALIHLLMRDDPLLKSHDFDDKEREYRNVSIIQNIFYILEQLAVINNDSTKKMKSQLESVYNKVKDAYFQKQLGKTIGKLIEFVNNYETLVRMNDGKPKKYNKKYIKSLLTGYTSRDIQIKASEIHRKLEKHFVSGNDMFEKDLLDSLWIDVEGQYVDYFSRLMVIIRSNFGDIEYSISKQEIHNIFKSIH